MKNYFKHKNRKVCLNRYHLLLICLFTLITSCQKAPQANIYRGSFSYENGETEIEVKNGRYQEALEQYKLILQQVSEDSIKAANIYNNMGGIYAEYLGERDLAESYINKAISIHQKENDKVGLADDYAEMSKIYLSSSEEAEIGLEYIGQSIKIYRELDLKDALGLADALLNQGHLYMKKGMLNEVLVSLKEANDIYQKRQEEEIALYILTGQVYTEMEDYDSAMSQLIKAKKIGETKNEQDRVADVNFQIGWLYGEMEDSNKSIEYYNHALNYYKTDKAYTLDQAVTYNNIAYSYAKTGDLRNALEFSVYACRTLEKEELISNRIAEDKKHYKNNLSKIYKKINGVTSDDEFEIWYQDKVIRGE